MDISEINMYIQGLVVFLSFIAIFNSNDKKRKIINVVFLFLISSFIVYAYSIYGDNLLKPMSEVDNPTIIFFFGRFASVLTVILFLTLFDITARMMFVMLPSLLLVLFLPDSFSIEFLSLSSRYTLILPLTVMVSFNLTRSGKDRFISIEEDETGETKLTEEETFQLEEEKQKLLRLRVIAAILFIVNMLILLSYYDTHNIRIVPSYDWFSYVGLFVYEHTILYFLIIAFVIVYLLYISEYIKVKWIKNVMSIVSFLIFIVSFTFMFGTHIREVPEYASITDEFSLQARTLNDDGGYIYSGYIDGDLYMFVEFVIDDEYKIYYDGKDDTGRYLEVEVEVIRYSDSVVYFNTEDIDDSFIEIEPIDNDDYGRRSLIKISRLKFESNQPFVIINE